MKTKRMLCAWLTILIAVLVCGVFLCLRFCFPTHIPDSELDGCEIHMFWSGDVDKPIPSFLLICGEPRAISPRVFPSVFPSVFITVVYITKGETRRVLDIISPLLKKGVYRDGFEQYIITVTVPDSERYYAEIGFSEKTKGLLNRIEKALVPENRKKIAPVIANALRRINWAKKRWTKDGGPQRH